MGAGEDVIVVGGVIGILPAVWYAITGQESSWTQRRSAIFGDHGPSFTISNVIS